MMRLGFGRVTCEDCPSRTTAHIKKRQVFEGSPIHPLSPECEGLEYEMTEIFKCMISPHGQEQCLSAPLQDLE